LAGIGLKMKIGIVGGTGKTGMQFARFFKSKGYEVFISHYKFSKARRIAKNNGLKALTNEELMKKCNVVFFSVPISKTEQIVKQLAPLANTGTLLSDFTSLKEMPIKAMLKYSNPKIEVIGLHPMFGPAMAIKGENIIVVPGRGKKFIPWIKQVFKGSKLIFSTGEEHDKTMTVVQCLVHFPSITTAMAMKRLKLNLAKVEKFSTPIYRERIETIRRVLSQTPELYGDIEMYNSHSKKAIDAFIQSNNELRAIIKGKRRAKFADLYKELADYFKKS
jgi:prephenate dehydrogenase